MHQIKLINKLEVYQIGNDTNCVALHFFIFGFSAFSA